MAQNTLMFEVGISRANDSFDSILKDVEKLAKLGKDGINIKVQLGKTDELQKTIDVLAKLGDPNVIKPLQDAIKDLRQQLVELGKGGYTNNELKNMKSDAEAAKKAFDDAKAALDNFDRFHITGRKASEISKSAKDERGKKLAEVESAEKTYNELKNIYDRAAQSAENLANKNKEIGNAPGLDHIRTQMDGVNATVKTLAENMNALVTKLGEGNTASKGGILDPKQFTALQEAISQVIREVNRLGEALAGLKFGNLEELTTVINALRHNASTASDAMKAIDTGAKFNKSEAEIAAYEQRVKELKTEIANLEAQAKNTAEAVKKVNNEFKSVSEKSGSEDTKNRNLDVLKAHIKEVYEALSRMAKEYSRLENEKAFDANLKAKIDNLRAYHDWLLKVQNGQVDLSKAGALKSTEAMFKSGTAIGDVTLMGKVAKQWYSEREVKSFGKMVDDVLAAKKAAESLNDSFDRMKQKMLGVGSSSTGGMRGVSANLETINKVGELNIQTLIKEQGHIERLMNVARQSIKFGEKYDVMGMGTQRAQQRANLEYLENVKRMIDYILQNRNQPEWMRFLNTSSSLRLPLPGSGNDIALLGGHFDQLTHSVTTTAKAMRQLKADMTLDSANWNKQWNTDNLTRGLYNIDTAIKNIMQSWEKVSATASPEMAKIVAQQLNNLNAVRRDIASAMDNQNILGSRHGYATAMNANYHIQLKEAKVVLKDINELEKTNSQLAKEAEKKKEQATKAAAKAQEAAAKQQARNAKNAIKENERWAKSIDDAKTKYNELAARIKGFERIEKRGGAAGIDVSRLSSMIATLKNNLGILRSMMYGSKIYGETKTFVGGSDYKVANAAAQREANEVSRALNEKKRLINEAEKQAVRAEAQQLREAEKYTRESIKSYNMWAESIRKAGVEATILGIKIRQLEQTETRAKNAKVDTTAIHARIEALRKEQDILKEINSGSKAYGTTKDYIRSEKYQSEIKLATEANRVANQTALAQERADNKAIKDLETKETNQRKYNSALNDMENILKRLSSAEARGTGLGLDTTKIQSAINMLNQFIDKTLNFDTRNFGDNHAVRELTAEWNTLKKTLTEVAKEQDNLSKAQERANAAAAKALSAENAARRQAVQQIREQAQASVNARRESLQAQAKELQQLLSLGSNKLGTTQYDAVRDALRAIREELRQIETMTQRGGLSSGLLMSMGSGRGYTGVISSAQAVVGMKEKAVTVTNQLADAERRFGEALMQSTNQMQKQSQVLSDLKMMALQYVSVWGAQSFINNIIEQGGQLEQQRLSIQAILGDAAHAQTLFNQVKALAIKSPFGVTQIDQMTKQLSAYGFQYSELFDLTKRLADISAATGTEVSRLALALGHVKSEAALSGYTLRQFSMANVPLLTKLTEKLGVSAKEVRNMVRKKEIGYDIVLEILKELTDESGMFYNAQETMSEALNAKFKNLRDSFQIMYSEMAEGAPGDFLKGVAVALTEMSKNWKTLIPMIGVGAAAFVSLRLSTMALNKGFAVTGSLMKGNAIAASQYTMAQLRLMVAQRQVLRTTGLLNVALAGIGSVFKRIGSFIFNPVNLGITALFAAVEGLVYAWQRHNQEMEKAKSLTTGFGQEGSEGAKNLTERLNQTGTSSGKNSSELKQGIDSMTSTLRDYGVDVGKIMNDAFGTDANGKVRSLAEQYDYLRGKMAETLDVYRELERTKGAFEYGINSTNDGIFDDDVNTNLTKYAEAVKTLDATIADFYGKHGDDIDKAVEKAVDSDKNFAKATENMKNNAEKFREYVLKPLDYPSASETMNESLSKAYSLDRMNINEAYGKLSETKEMAMKELDDFFENTEKYYETKGYDFEALTAIQIDNLMKQSRDYLKLHPEWSAIMDDLKRKFEERWPIKIDITPESSTDKLSDWQQQMQDWLNAHNLKELIQIKGDMSREDIIKLIHEKLKDAQEVVDNTKPILLRFGVSLDNIPSGGNLPKGLQTPWGKHQASDYKENSSNILGLNDFLKEFDLPAPKDKNKTKAKKEDKEAKELRERVRILKEAADSYQYWRKAVGDNGAVTHVNDEFGKLLSEQKFSFENVKKFRETLTALRKEYEKKPKTKAMLEALKELDKIFADLDRKDFEKKSDDFLSTIQIELDTLTRAWDIFNKVREATGDVELAVTLSGVNVKSGTETLADALKNKIRKDFAEAGGVGNIIFDSNMSDKDVQRLFENAIPQGAKESAKQYEERIKGIVEEYTKWRDLQRDVTSKDIDVFSKLIGSAVDLQTRIQLINNEFMTTMQSLDRLRAEGRISSDEYNRASSMGSANHQMKLVQASDAYQMLMDGIVTMNKKAARTIRQDFINALEAQLKAGTITAKDYADKIHEVNEKMQELEKAPSMFQSYMQGGLDGLFKNMDTQGRAKSYQGGQMIQDAQKMIDSSFGEGGNFEMFQQGISKMANGKEMAQIGQGMSQMGGQMAQTVAIIDMIVHGIDNIVQGLNDTYGEIKDMYTALGENTESDGWQDSSTFFSSFSKASASATKGWDSLKNGDMGGVISGVVGSFTNWVTGFAQGHDAKREQHIEDLKFEVSKIDNTLEKIRSMRERELGYDSGSIRRILSERYSREALASSTPVAGVNWSADPDVSQAMADYYNQSSSGTGYRQELELVETERQKYIDMYTEEAEKKNSSEEALEEYKNKIAELDEKIMYFTEDLGKELWGLDIKGWADQIGDALMTAFENGEDAMEAFNATAKDIVRSVVSEMMKLGVIQPMLRDLRKALFGEEGAESVTDENGDKWRGVYNETKGMFDQEKTQAILGQFFGEKGLLSSIPSAAKQFYDMAEKMTGMDLSSNDSSTTSKIIQGGFTENETGLLLSYANGIRADVSINRDLLTQYLPSLQAAMTAGNASLQTIASNTTAIMKSNDSINNNVIDLRSDIRGLKNGAWKMPTA